MNKICHFSKQHLTAFFFFQFILTGIYSSFVPLSVTGIFYRLSGITLLLMWYFAGYQQKEWLRFTKSSFAILFLSLFAYQTLTYFYSSTPSLSRDFLEGRFWITTLIIVLCDIKHEKRFVSWTKQSLELILILTFCYGMYQFFIGFPQLRHALSPEQSQSIYSERLNWRLNSSEIFSTYLYPNLLSHFCFICLISLTLWFKKGFAQGLKFICLGSAICITALLSQSKGAPIAFMGAVIVGLSFRLIKQQRKGHLTIFYTIVSIVFYLFHNPIFVILKDSIDIRVGYLKSSLEMIHHHPWGVGINNFSEYYLSYLSPESTIVKIAHNDPLQILCETGFIGLVLFFFIKGRLLTQSYKHILELHKHEEHPFPLWPKIVIFTFITISCLILYDGPFTLTLYGPSFCLILLILFIISSKTQKQNFIQYTGSLPFILICFFIFHSLIDFPFYDHSLYGIFLILALSLLPSDMRSCKPKQWIKNVTFLLLFSISVMSFMRHQALYECLAIEYADGFEKSDFDTLKSLCEKNPQELKPWSLMLEKLQHHPKILNSIDGQTFYHKTLEHLLHLKPRNSKLQLLKAKSLGISSKAETHYLNAIEFFPRKAIYHLNYAQYLDLCGRGEESFEHAKEAFSLHQHAQFKSKTSIDFELFLLSPNEFEMLQLLLNP